MTKRFITSGPDLALIEGPPNQALAASKWHCWFGGRHCSKNWRHASVQTSVSQMLDIVRRSHTVKAYSSCGRTMDLLHLTLTFFHQLEDFCEGRLWPFLSLHQCTCSRTVNCL